VRTSRSTPERAPIAPASGLLSGTPLGLLAVLAVLLAACAVLVQARWLPSPALAVVTVAVAHGGLLSMAFGWAAMAPPRWAPLGPSAISIVVLAIAAAGAVWDPRAAILYVVSPLWLAILAVGGRLDPLGLRGAMPVSAMLLGIGAGLALGGHLLIAAAGTFGYRVKADSLVLSAIAYDVGANVPSSELFFRGALFNRLQRRWSFGAAVTVATALGLLRYLLDPLLPKAPEMVVGTLLYVTLLGVINAWLLWWSGSLLPGLLAALVFFSAYRMITVA